MKSIPHMRPMNRWGTPNSSQIIDLSDFLETTAEPSDIEAIIPQLSHTESKTIHQNREKPS
jgi:hypothetical protein